MDLKQFVAETLEQIVRGVAEASQKVEGVGDAVINPAQRGTLRAETAVAVEFTVALSVGEGTETKGGIGVVAGIFALGSQGASKEATASTTHVRFRVPVALPTSK